MKMLTIILFLNCACILPFSGQAQLNIISTIVNKDTVNSYGGDNGPAINAFLSYPEAIHIDKVGNLYIADVGNNRIRKVNTSSGIITTIVGRDTGGYYGDNGPATNAGLFFPEDVCIDTSGNIYIADALNNRIRKVIVATGIITTIAGNGTSGSSGDNGLAINAELSNPSGLFVDVIGNVFIADYYNNKVRKVNASTGIIITIAGTGTAGYSGDNGLAINAELNGPVKVFGDSIGDIYISDQWNSVVRKLDNTTGNISTIVGNGTAGYYGDNGAATNAEMDRPGGLYVDMQNNIFIAEFGNGVIRKVNGSTGIITTIAGTGIWGFSGDGGPATNAQMVCTDMFFDSYSNMYIADYGNNCIREVQSGLGIHNLIQEDVVKIYPNPTTGAFVIETNANNNQSSVEIFDVVGNKVRSFDKLRMTTLEVDISDLPAGVYMVQVTDAEDGSRVMKKVVKE